MKLLAIIIALSLSSVMALDIYAPDKAAHLFGCYAITDVCETKLGMNWWQSGAAVYLLSTLKEMGDPVFDPEDVNAGILGWGLKRLVFEVKF